MPISKFKSLPLILFGKGQDIFKHVPFLILIFNNEFMVNYLSVEFICRKNEDS